MTPTAIRQQIEREVVRISDGLQCQSVEQLNISTNCNLATADIGVTKTNYKYIVNFFFIQMRLLELI